MGHSEASPSDLKSSRPRADERLQLAYAADTSQPQQAAGAPAGPSPHGAPPPSTALRIKRWIFRRIRNTPIGNLYLRATRADSLSAALQLRMDRAEGELSRLAASRLDALEAKARQLDDSARSFEARSSQQTDQWRRVSERLDETEARLSRLQRHLASEHALSNRAYSDISRRLDILRHAPTPRQEASQGPYGFADSPGFKSLLDAFYNRIEDRYRGSREEIKRRLLKYLPDAEGAVRRSGGLPVVDLGCGRGEWLELLHEQGIAGIGIDTNPVQLEEAQGLGLDMREGDALAWLAEAPSASASMITAHHLIEHLPFDTVAWMTREALRVLAPGGVLLYETPNPHNVLVSAVSFHTDPTHLKPVPEEVLSTLFDTVGYHPVEIRRLHPHERLDEFIEDHGMDPELAHLLFGPQDCAILGTRPATGS